MMRSKSLYIFIILFLNVGSLFSRDIILEFKGAYLLPVDSIFKECYKGSALYGPELSVQLKNDKNWYAFFSLDYFQKRGRHLRRCDSTKLKLLPLAAGIKYFIPAGDRTNFYVGAGFQPVYIRTKNRRGCVVSKTHQWGYGGIAKLGAYINIFHNFLLDVFIDYSYIRSGNLYGHTVTDCKSNTSAFIFGAALGYRF